MKRDSLGRVPIREERLEASTDGAAGDASLNVGETARFVGAQAAPGTPAFDQEASAAAIAPHGTEFLGQELYAGTSVLGQANSAALAASSTSASSP